ncbi:sensor histidine kinase [Nonomuraea sp. NPDC050663]|uniref:sensor histidine kinase n=1 Tax=Nonomuraea sp. NPDC050663 TaxID=3364370 RepID=UPI00379CEBC9
MSLRARLLAGLLAVSTILLLTLGTVSVVVLRDHLVQRLESQLDTAARTTAVRVFAAPGGQLDRMLTGSTYAAVSFNAGTGKARLINGDAPASASVPGLVERLGRNLVRQHAEAGRIFTLDNGMRARAVAQNRQPNRVIVLAVPMDAVEAPVRRLILAELLTGVGLILLLLAVGRRLIVSGLAPLSRMAATAHHMAAGGDLSLRMQAGHSEVGRLAGAVNVLLDRIAEMFRDRWASEDRVRRFAADASHELRTPLSTIRGYAELYRTGAIPPAELPKIMGRIEDEATRMGDLVGQLLELARLDRGAELQLDETDLAAVVREIAADCAAVAPAFPIIADVPDSLPAVVDEPRFRQVVVNLLANVRAHTPAGTSAVVRLSRPEHGGVLLVVEDTGPGVKDPDRAFDRFHKGSPDGTGLGLAIVKAITEAHGGRCWITTGGGTAVHVELPAFAG